MRGDTTRSHILNSVRKSKYFSIILDYTPGICHIEQLFITLRFYDVEDIEIKEDFVCFKPIFDSTAEGLYDNISGGLEEFNLELACCRGQGYNNGANIKGNNTRVQSRMIKENPRQLYQKIRENSVFDTLKSAKDLAALLQVNARFKLIRIRKRKKQYTYEYDDEIPNVNDPEKYYKNQVFNVVDMFAIYQ